MIYDYIVIGSGFGGSLASLRLVEKGYKVLMIEQGTGVGGGSLVYANTLYIPPDEFFINDSWSRFGDWKKKLEPFFDKAYFMLGRKKYNPLNIEDKILEEEWKKKYS